MSLTARHLLELRKAEGKGKRLSKFPGFYSSNTMTIRGRYGRAYIEEGRERGCIPLLKAMSETEWDEKGAFLRCTRTDDGRNSVLFCIREMRSRCGALLLGSRPLANDAAIETNGRD